MPLDRELRSPVPSPGWLIVIGGSAGAVAHAEKLVAAFPEGVDAAVVIVIHGSPDFRSQLPEIFGRSSRLPVSEAIHGERLVAGRVYVAPRDNHVAVRAGALRVVRGPKENGHRPAVDPLFRSAAASYGAAAVGVVLSGTQTCGTNGARAIKAAGGRVLVQSPAEAPFPEMPASALDHARVDGAYPVQELGARLVAMVSEPPPRGPVEATTDEDDAAFSGTPSTFTCPQCNGSLVEGDEGGATQFRCHVGHRFDLDGLMVEQEVEMEMEAALWAGVRALEEGAELAERVERRSTGKLADSYRERAATLRRHAETVRHLLLYPSGHRGEVPAAG